MQSEKNIRGEKAQRGHRLSIESATVEHPPLVMAPSGKPSSHDEGARRTHQSRHIENSSSLQHESGIKGKLIISEASLLSMSKKADSR